MGGEVCYQGGKEKGPWFEIQEVRKIIITKEADGEDASFERRLLRSWQNYQGYESAGEALRTLGKSKFSGIRG